MKKSPESIVEKMAAIPAEIRAYSKSNAVCTRTAQAGLRPSFYDTSSTALKPTIADSIEAGILKRELFCRRVAQAVGSVSCDHAYGIQKPHPLYKGQQ